MSILSKLKQSSFILTGLTSYLRLYIVNKCLDEGRKVVLLTATEINAQKYQSDIKKIFNKDAAVFPYQSISPYELLYPDFYDLSNQTSIITELPQLIIVPARALMESFPAPEFYKKYSLNFKIGDEVSPQELSDVGFVQHTYLASAMAKASFPHPNGPHTIMACGSRPACIVCVTMRTASS